MSRTNGEATIYWSYRDEQHRHGDLELVSEMMNRIAAVVNDYRDTPIYAEGPS